MEVFRTVTLPVEAVDKETNMKKKKIYVFFHKYINGTKGVISLMLAILMVPFASIAGALINAGRINSAVAIFDEALCNASNSTLGTYDEFLRSRFALMAISQDTSKGGTEFGSTSANYTADNLINDLFQYYMEQNVGCLSNTYQTTKVQAAGIYPLSDPSVLKSAVIQTSKITVPAKLAIDWGSLDDMLSKFTKPLSLLSSFESTLSSGMTVATKFDELADKQEAFEEKIKKCNEARTKYNDAYLAFQQAADQFNTLVDNINNTSARVTAYQQQVDTLSSRVEGINSQIKQKQDQIQQLFEDESSDHTEQIQKINEEIADLEEEREEIAPGYQEAVQNLNAAKTRLSLLKSQFPGKRLDALDAKAQYYGKIVALRDKVNETSSAALAFQSTAQAVISSGTSFVSSTISTAFDVARKNNQDQIDDLKQQNEELKYHKILAENDGYDEYVTHYENITQENNSLLNTLNDNGVDLGNEQKITSAAMSAMQGAYGELKDFSNRDLVSEYRTIYDELNSLRLKIDQIVIPENYSKINYDSCHYDVVNPVEKSEISQIVKNIEDQIVNSGGWAVLKAIVSFVKALISISIFYDPELDATIDTGLYSVNGGLPSKINREDHPITSPYEQADKAQSEIYKKLTAGYETYDAVADGAGPMSAFSVMKTNIDLIVSLMNRFELRNLKKLAVCGLQMISSITGIGNHMKAIAQAANVVGPKLLITGYVSYNTANRTTYSGKALAGASFGLPGASAASGYVFSGAETEYIFRGSMSERENQKSVFTSLWIERIIFSIFAVIKDATIATIASNLGAFTFGIGFAITYAVCFALEGVLDAIILANGGDLPILKTTAYISPAGIPKLLEKIFHLGLKAETKKKIYEDACACAYKINSKAMDMSIEHDHYTEDQVEFPRYDDYQSEQKKKDGKFSNIFTIDYTKSVQLLLLIFVRTDDMIARLADIIQMEASYKASSGVATYGFNLDKSYTYLRASGSFSSNVFIKIGDKSSLISEERVIYNGY